MADYSDLATAAKAVVDPATSAADLAQITQTQPSLWAQIAGHPNAFPGLLDWLAANGDVSVRQAVDARAQFGPANQSPGLPHSGGGKSRKALFGAIGGAVAVVVIVVLVVTLIVLPNHRAAQAAAAAASASAQAQQDAVTAFDTARKACTDADSALAGAVKSAQAAAKTDPSTMQDPTLIDTLNQELSKAQGITQCTAPPMAGDTATIQSQTAQITTDTQPLTAAASTLAAATQEVTISAKGH